MFLRWTVNFLLKTSTLYQKKQTTKLPVKETAAVTKPPVNEELFEKRYQEGYDVPEKEYSEWLKSAHPDTSSESTKTHCNLESTQRERLEKIKKKHDKPTKKSTRSRSKVLGKAMEELGLPDSDDNCECPKCKLHLDGVQWICCDSCDVWFHTKCTTVAPDDIPDIFYCESCI